MVLGMLYYNYTTEPPKIALAINKAPILLFRLFMGLWHTPKEFAVDGLT